MSTGYCAKCREHSAYLVPLHGEKGGTMCCLTCVGAWHAEHGRKRNRGRVAIRAMKGFLDAGARSGATSSSRCRRRGSRRDRRPHLRPRARVRGAAASRARN